MGEECLEILTASLIELEALQKLSLNLSKNCLSPEVLCDCIEQLQNLANLHTIDLDVKRNIRRVEDRDQIRQVLMSLPAKNKTIDI